MNTGNPVEKAANAVANAASGAVTATTNAVQNAVKNVNKAVNAGVNAGAAAVNSLIPFGNGAAANNKPKNNAGAGNNNANKPKNNAGANNSVFGNLFGNNANANANKPKNNAGAGTNNNAGAAPANNTASSPPATFGNFSVSKNTESPWANTLGIFLALVVFFLFLFSVFNKQIKQGYEYIATSVKQALGLPSKPDVDAAVTPADGTVQDVTTAPSAPQDLTPSQQAMQQQSLVEKLLPSSAGTEVYNISKNDFNYYDAEPLCKALGAELATYEQVKEAWNKGADWCNYGWVKGQMAVYPTQKGTYDKLQAGPEDQRNACGTVGINGGFFDNPEMRFGVNCYGKKPSQSAHDEKRLMEEGKVPRSPETLKVDEMMNKFKSQADSLFVKPFNDDKWSTA